MQRIGTAEVYRDKNGNLKIDKTTLRREDVGDDDFGDDDLGEDVGNDDVGDEVAGRGDRRSRRRSRQDARRENRRERQDERQDNRRERQDSRGRGNNQEDDVPEGWVKTTVSGVSNTPTGSGQALTITVRPQHDFDAEDITFTGGTSNADTIESIFFGATPVWSNTTGTPISVFGTGSFLRGLLKGQKIRGGLDIVIKGTSAGSAAVTATLVGYKPAARC